MRTVPFEGRNFDFPDDVTDDEIAEALSTYTAPTEWGQIAGQIMPEIGRSLATQTAGAVKAGADIGLLEPERGAEAMAVRKEVATERKTELPPNMSILQEGVLAGTTSAATQLPTVGALVLGGVPAFGARVAAGTMTPAAMQSGLIGAATTPMGITSGLEKYGESREYGLSPSRSALHGLLHGLIEKYTEYLPLRDFNFATGKLSTTIGKFLGKELVGEEVATALQSLNDKMSTRPNMTLGEWAHDAAVTAVATAVSGPLQAGAVRTTAAAMRPFIKEEFITPEQKTALENAATVAGVPQPTVTVMGPNGELVQTPANAVGAVPAAPTAMVDLQDYAMPDQHPSIPEGMVRLYTVVPPESKAPEMTTWTADLSKIQEAVNAIGPTARVPYLDITPTELAKTQEQEDVQKIRMEQHAVPEKDYVLPSSLITSGKYLYNPPLGAPTSTVKVAPTPAAQPTAVGEKAALTWQYKHDKGKARITFPDRESKALAFYANHVDAGDTYASQEQLATERGQLATAYGVPEDKVAEIAKAYRDEIVNLARQITSGTMNPPRFNFQDYEKQQAVQNSPELKSLVDFADKAKRGEVGLMEGVKETVHVKKMRAYLQNWMSMFTPETKLVIRGVAEAGSTARMRAVGGVTYILLPSESDTPFWSVFSLAHEFGHHVYFTVMMKPEHREAVAQLRLEHAELMERIHDISAAEFIKQYMAPNSVAHAGVLLQSYGVRATDPAMYLVEALDAKRPGALVGVLSFEEYAAEQFARYIGHEHEKVFVSTVKTAFKGAVESVKDFFTKVVKKIAPQEQFGKWVDRLRLEVSTRSEHQERADETTRSNYLIGDVYFNIANEQMAITTKVLARLPKKQKINRITITDQLKRPDVKGQEKELFESVLKTFDGDVIDRTQLVERVLEKIVPLETMLSAPGQNWANYGLSHIGVNSLQVEAYTELFRLPFDISTANHFNDPKYFGHARWFEWIDTDITKMGREAGLREAAKTRSIVELQNDLAQKSGTEIVTTESLANAEKVLEVAKRQFTEIQAAVNAVQLGEMNTKDIGFGGIPTAYPKYAVEIDIYGLRKIVADNRDVRFPADADVDLFFGNRISRRGSVLTWVDPTLQPQIETALIKELEMVRLRVEEERVNVQAAQERLTLNIPERIKTLPDRWWGFMLRKLNSEAARDGVKVMRMASAGTVAKVEGWRQRKLYFFPNMIGHKTPESGVTTGWISTDRDGDFNGGDVQVNENGKNVWRHIMTVNLTLPSDSKYTKTDVDYGTNQGIYDRYAGEITRFVKREFGAKEVSNRPTYDALESSKDRRELEDTTSWLEWDVKPELAGIPVEYYDVVDSLGNASEKLTKANESSDRPELTKSFERFQGFLQLGLKLSQMARILPNVQQLQKYRQLTEQEANLKNQLLSSTNDTLKAWYNLSQKDSVGVQEMARAEESEGKHWTELKQETVTISDQPAVMWAHEGTQRIIDEAKKRGMTEKGVKVYLQLKNDFLIDLGVMEKTVLSSINHFFRNNPIAANARRGIVQRQFQQWREVPYVPDRRFGQWSVIVKNKTEQVVDGKLIKANEVIHFARHETETSQRQEFAALKKQYGSQFTVVMDYVEDKQYVMRSLPRAFIEALPQSLELDADQMAKFDELYYDLTREGAYLKMMGRGKKRIPGAEVDLRRSYADQRWRTANLIAKMTYGYQLQGQLRSLSGAITSISNNGGSVVPLRRLHEWLQKHYEYVHTPQHEFEQLRAFVSLWYLWGSPKTALMNTTTIMTTTYPALAQRYGDAQAVGAITSAMKNVAMSWKHPEKVSREWAAVLQQGKVDGSVNQSFAAEAAAVADGYAIEKILPSYSLLRKPGVKDRARKATWNLIHFGMLPFRVAEEFNRRSTLLAAYTLAKKAGATPIEHSTKGTAEGSAYFIAKDLVSLTQNEYAPWDRARFLMGKQSVFLIFQSFVQNMAFFVFGGDKGWWRSWLVLGALAGLQGLPGAENVLDLLNWLSRKMDPNDHTDLRIQAREVAESLNLNPDIVMHGMSHSMFGLGWDTSASLSLGRIIPGTDAAFGQGDATRRLMQMSSEIGGPFAGLTLNVLQAVMDENPSMLLTLDRALPPLIRNLERAYRGASDSRWTDTKGRPLVDEVTGLEVLGQAMGFTPTPKSTVQELLHLQNEAAQFYALRRQNLLTGLWQAKQSGDADKEAVVKEAIDNYNNEIPDPQLRITAQEIQQSMKARERTNLEKSEGVPAIRRYRGLYERISSAFPEARN